MKRRTKIKMNIPMCAACVLFCLTLLSTYMTGGLFARYTTEGSVSDSAKVMKFGKLTLTETGDFYDEGKLMIIPGVDLQKKAVLDFEGSESSVYVFISVIPEGHTTEDNSAFAYIRNSEQMLAWSIDSGWEFLPGSSSGGEYIYYRELKPGEELVSADIFANDGKVEVSETITRNDIASMTDISIKIYAAVVQSNGFDSADDAWESIVS